MNFILITNPHLYRFEKLGKLKERHYNWNSLRLIKRLIKYPTARYSVRGSIYSIESKGYSFKIPTNPARTTTIHSSPEQYPRFTYKLWSRTILNFLDTWKIEWQFILTHDPELFSIISTIVNSNSQRSLNRRKGTSQRGKGTEITEKGSKAQKKTVPAGF